MKNYFFTLLAGALLFVATGCSAPKSAVRSEADMATAGQIDRMLAGRLYKVDFRRAYPTMGPSFTLTSPYYISVIGDRVESFLPYFGRAYSLPYGGGEGLRFEGSITGYAENVAKKGQREISFTAETDEDVYDFSLTVWPLGECDLVISPTKKQNISFTGNIDLDPEFEAVRVE